MFTNRALKRLIIPLFLDQILIITVGIIATIMLSYAGEAAVSGVSLVEMINMLLINVFAALSTGGAVVVSQYIGRKEGEKARFAASQLITVTTLFSVFVLLLVTFFHKPILQILFGNIDEDVMAAAITYFIISGLSYPFLAVYNSCAALFRSMGNSRVPMIVSIIMNLVNVIGNAVGIFALHMGVTGVAFAALFARIIAAGIILGLSFSRKNEIYLRFSVIFSWNRDMQKKILNIAIPNGIENGIVQLGRVLLISIIALFGTTQITANGITNSLVMMSISFASAMNLAIVTVIGQCVGAGDYEQADYYMKKLIRLTYLGTIMISIGEILLLPWILNLYTLSTEAHQLTYLLVIIHNAFAIFLWPIAFTLSSGMRAAGDVRFTMVISICSMFIFRISFAVILGVVFQLGVIGVWIAMGIDWSFRSIVFLLRYKRGKWKTFKVI
jgi:putative MATE family efflux protein